jgi:hypothetical protein
MARGAQFITHKGKEIYFVDYSNIKTNEEFLKTIKETNAFREKITASGKKNLLMLVDITGSYIYGEVLDEIKRSGKLTKPLTKKEAVVGLTGGQKILLQFFQMFTKMQLKVFDTQDDAKEWLIKI